MWKLLTHNWNLKLTALVLAVVLWSHVRGEINPLETGVFRVPLRATLPREMLITHGKVPAWVLVTLRAPRQTLRELRETDTAPAAALPNPLAPVPPTTLHNDDVSAHLDFGSGNAPPMTGAVTVPVRADCQLPDVQVFSTNPESVPLQLDRAAQLSRPVQPQIAANPDVTVRVTTLAPAQVTLYGPSEALKRVARVIAPLTSPTTSGTRRVTLLLRAVDTQGRDVTGVVSEPLTTRVEFGVSERVVSKTLRLVPIVQGAPVAGFRVTQVSVEPLHITVRGPRRVVARLQSLPVALDASAATTDIQRKVELSLPPGVSLAAGKLRPVAEVRARVAAIKVSPPQTRTTSVSPEARGGGQSDVSDVDAGARLAPPFDRAQPTASRAVPPPAAD